MASVRMDNSTAKAATGTGGSDARSIPVRAAVLRRSGIQGPYALSRPLAVETVHLAPPGPGEIQVAVRAAGVCHSDLSAINGDRPWPVPIVLGHEATGEVVATGPGVTRFTAGDAVVMVFKPTCGRCEPCLSGRGVLCEPGSAANAAGTLLGGHRRLSLDGEPLHHHLGVAAFAERITVSEHSAVRIERGIPWEIAALFGCAVLTGAGAVFNAGGVRPGQSVAVVGLGGVGSAALLAARAAGATTRVAVDRVPEKLTAALDLGATHVVDASAADAADRIRELTGGGPMAGVDVALEMAGAVPALELAYAVTRRGGTMVTAGLPNPAARWPLPATSLIAEEKTVKGSYMGSAVAVRDIPRLIALWRQGLMPVERLLGATLPLDRLHDALDSLASGQTMRQVIVFPEHASPPSGRTRPTD
jgi:alcohol dehydrogenase